MKISLLFSMLIPNIRLAFALFVAIVAGLLANASFMYIKQPFPQVYQPNKDFSFLKRFYCISDLFSKEQWENNKGRSFDKDGIHLTNSKKHPVNACHYALFCFDEFKSTGDSAYYEAFMSQVNYLRDKETYHEVDIDKIGYPYLVAFHDLKPPWYSALAQSEAISVLIRYFSITNDESVLPLIVKIKNFMASSQEFTCGTMSITPEGNKWYEEYPNSKQEKQVLNGFLLSIVALHEYTNLFPDDTATVEEYNDAIKTVKASFKYYDTGTWLKYNRGDGRQVANGYMKWQVLELKLLYELTGDIYFKHLMMLISTYCYNKPYETAGSKLMDYDFSVPLTEGKNEMLFFEGKRKQIVLNNSSTQITNTFHWNKNEFAKVIDNNTNTFARFKYNDSLANEIFKINLTFSSTVLTGSISIAYSGIDSLIKPKVAFTYKDTVSQKKISKIKIHSIVSESKIITYHIEPVNSQFISIEFENPDKFKEINIANLAIYEPVKDVASDYIHYLSPIYSAVEKNVKFDFEYKDMKNIAIFHKSANDEKALKAEKWDSQKVYTRVPILISNSKHKLHRYLIVCEKDKPSATIGKVKFSE